jgi:hypothetical protein
MDCKNSGGFFKKKISAKLKFQGEFTEGITNISIKINIISYYVGDFIGKNTI